MKTISDAEYGLVIVQTKKILMSAKEIVDSNKAFVCHNTKEKRISILAVAKIIQSQIELTL